MKNMQLSRDTAKLTSHEMIEKLQDENKYLRETIVEKKVKSEGSINTLNKSVFEFKDENTYLSSQLGEYRKKLSEANKHYINK